MLASTFSKRAYSSVSPDFLASVLQRVKEVPIKAREPRKPRSDRKVRSAGREDKRQTARFDDRSGGNKPRDNRQVRNGQDRGGKNFRERTQRTDTRGTNGPVVQTGTAKRQTPKITGTNEYSEISGKVQNLGTRQNRRSDERKTRKTVPGLKISSNLGSENVVQNIHNSAVYVPQDPTPLSLLRYRPALAPTFSARTFRYAVSTLKDADFPVHRSLNDGVTINGKNVSKRMTANKDNFGEYVPASILKLQVEPLTKNIQISPDLEKLEQSVKGSFHILKPYTKKDFAKLTKAEDKREQLLQNSEIVRKSLEQSNLASTEKELLQKVCSGLAPVSELTA
ncbi:mitochondrial 37S ribosomal protein mS46 RSM28 [Kluyveromyces lactis]|uniref:KLLA0C12375p n=1 Tax=Kluyveromyces lactis (strain ATCC 8585 / CBS 2359 / DSM 70799 / NBRC 1267 / NRRL Y-1140 / WM37) TaxID=284590 RepID=Q6CTI9_KLULA|nr:uncharacterized protein KLLA0_C12375g [Kluyveromyces lactis]CAH01601.1 KLLA0C12375p [Kluyveromyces lactis]|eukprot:XP_452750.1 uncharacterized protein KLLA0_C12375g [Kluyveromyces lactis]